MISLVDESLRFQHELSSVLYFSTERFDKRVSRLMILFGIGIRVFKVAGANHDGEYLSCLG